MVALPSLPETASRDGAGRGVHHRNLGVLHDGAALIDHDDDHRRRVGRLRHGRSRKEGKESNQKEWQAQSILGFHMWITSPDLAQWPIGLDWRNR